MASTASAGPQRTRWSRIRPPSTGRPVPAPKYRIFQTLSGNYFFRFYPDDSNDIAQSHSYPHKDSLLRRIERMRNEGGSPLAQDEE
ncbi:MAG: hypothetical protein LKE43_00865 [Olsenella sp.]|nr:hypothetical protein [Olsenella sp.]